MNDEDRAFLSEYASKTCLTHPVAALALHRAAADAEEVAIVVESLIRKVDRMEAESMAKDRGTAALVQTFIVARLIAQLAAAVEDCGALADAIRFRARDGLFPRYLASKSGVAGGFFDVVRLRGPLSDLLAIPELDRVRVGAEDRKLLEEDYQNLPQALRQIADIYRGEGVPGEWSGASEDGHLDVVMSS